MTSPVPARRLLTLPRVALGCLALTVAAYGNHFANGFHFDDSHVIENNLYIRSLANAGAFFTDAGTFSSLPANATYRPLLSLTYAVDHALAGGLDPRVFHGTQFLLHLLVVAGAFLLYREAGGRALGGRGPSAGGEGRLASWTALGAATWFAVHTANTETVNYLSSRSDLLSTAGILGSFALYLRVPASRRHHLYLAPMAVGALAKTPAVMFAPLLLVWMVLFEEDLSLGDAVQARSRSRVGAAVRRCLPAFVVGGGMFVLVEVMNPPAQIYGGGDPAVYARTQAWVWLHYLRLFALPLGLTADTDWTLIAQWWDTRVVAGAATVALLGWAAVAASRTLAWRPVAFGLAWFVLGLLPTSSVVPLAEVANEHRIYLPYVGLTLAVVWAGFLRARRHPEGVTRGAAALAVLLLLHAGGTWERNRVWRSEETLWRDVVAKSPGNGRAWMNFGLSRMAAGHPGEAREHFQRALELAPGYPHAHVNYAIASGALGDSTVAEQHFRTALTLDPAFVEGHFYFARWLVDAGRAPEALPHLRQAAALSPGHPPVRSVLLHLLFALGDEAALRTVVEETLRILPDHEEALAYSRGEVPLGTDDRSAAALYNLGFALGADGDHLLAAVAYRGSLALDAGPADTWNNLGWSLAQLGDLAAAEGALEEALRRSPDDVRAAGNLAWVRGRRAAEETAAPPS